MASQRSSVVLVLVVLVGALFLLSGLALRSTGDGKLVQTRPTEGLGPASVVSCQRIAVRLGTLANNLSPPKTRKQEHATQ